MIERTEARFNIRPTRLAADTAHDSASTLAWLVNGQQIAPHIPLIDKAKRDLQPGAVQVQRKRYLNAICIRATRGNPTTTRKVVNDDQLLLQG